MLFIVILVESPASHWRSLNSQKMVCHTGGSHFPGNMGIPGVWGPGSPFSCEYRDPGPHFPGSMGTRDPYFPGSMGTRDPYFHMTPVKEKWHAHHSSTWLLATFQASKLLIAYSVVLSVFADVTPLLLARR